MTDRELIDRFLRETGARVIPQNMSFWDYYNEEKDQGEKAKRKGGLVYTQRAKKKIAKALKKLPRRKYP